MKHNVLIISIAPGQVVTKLQAAVQKASLMQVKADGMPQPQPQG